MLIAGLRFSRKQAPALRVLADRVRLGEIEGDVETFEQAALAAATGEPLEVHCTTRTEVRRIVAGYGLNGVMPTAVDDLTPAA